MDPAPRRVCSDAAIPRERVSLSGSSGADRDSSSPLRLGRGCLSVGIPFAILAQLVVDSRTEGGLSLGRACGRVAGQPGWGSLLWRLYWRLALPGYLLTMAIGGIGYWVLTSLGVDFRSAEGRFLSESLGLVLGNLVFLLYAYRFALAIPLPVVAGDQPVDPLLASSSAGKRWRVPIIVSCFVAWGISDLADLHGPAMLLAPGLIRPSMVASCLVYISIALTTSLPWAWLFVFLTEVAAASAPELVIPAPLEPAPIP